MENKVIYVPVSVQEGLPEQMFNTVNSGDSWKCAYYHRDAPSGEAWSEDTAGKRLCFPTHWLKRIELPSEEEINNSLGEFQLNGKHRIEGANYILSIINQKK